LRARGSAIVGVDRQIAPEARAACTRTYALDLEQGLQLDHEPPFTTILLADVIEHVQRPGPLLDHCHRLLAPEGRLLVSTANIAHVTVRLGLLVGRFEYASRGILDRTHATLYTLRTLKAFLTSHQFRVTEVRVTPVPFEALFPRWADRWWVRGLNAIAYGFARAWKTLFAYQFIVVAEPLLLPVTMERVSAPSAPEEGHPSG